MLCEGSSGQLGTLAPFFFFFFFLAGQQTGNLHVPESGRTYGFTGAFLWPVEEVKPEEFLGDSLEALDSIRLQFKCHIMFDNQVLCLQSFRWGSWQKTAPLHQDRSLQERCLRSGRTVQTASQAHS